MSISEALDARIRFVRENTSILAPPHVPEIRLHLADEAHDLWQKTEDELQAIGLQPPFWAFAWAGGQGLARHVLDHPEIVRGKRVLDFASGSGLVGIAARLAGAERVTANDVDPFCAAAIHLNAGVNSVAVGFDGTDLLGSSSPADFDVILAGDVFYDRLMSERIGQWFGEAAVRGTLILVGDPGRSYLPFGRLTSLAVHEVAVTRALEDSDVKRTTVWQFVG